MAEMIFNTKITARVCKTIGVADISKLKSFNCCIDMPHRLFIWGMQLRPNAKLKEINPGATVNEKACRAIGTPKPDMISKTASIPAIVFGIMQ